MGLNTAYTAVGAEFEAPPADPVALLRDWYAHAVACGVREPGAVALATAAADGRPSNRMIQMSLISARGLVFASHIGSRKGREISETGWGSGVFYWRETNQQVTLTGRVELLPDADADALWQDRPPAANPMSVATRQSKPLADEQALRALAQRLADSGRPLVRPYTWVAYQLVPSTMEFWQSSPDRLYRRLRYDRAGDRWTAVRLQP